MVRDAHLEPYRESAKQHGNDFKVTLWANERSQRTRFEIMAAMLPLTGKRLLDAGCSRGDFAGYLIEQGISFGHYVGIDGLGDVIEFAATRGLPNCEFQCGDFIHHPELLSAGNPQVICISGALNTMTDPQVTAVLDASWESTEESLIFNFLSDRSRLAGPGERLGPARRLDTVRLLDWATRKTGAVAMRQDYFRLGHDATILMRKES